MKILRLIRSFFRKGRLDAEMTEEMRAHVELQTERNRAAGMGTDEARYAALRQFGNLASIQEQAREQRGWLGWENLVTDFRLGLRSLWKSPGFTILAIITLGLGIGINTAMFSAFNSILLRPLPYPDQEQLMRFFRATPQHPEDGFSAADFADMRRAIAPYGDVAAYYLGDAGLAEPGEHAEMASAARVTANLFPLLGTRLQLGRNFRLTEETAGNDRVVILSQRCWQNRFGGRTDIIGHTIRVDGEPHEVVGVLPASFNEWRHMGSIDFFRPLGLNAEKSAVRNVMSLRVIARRTGGMTPAEGDAFIAGLGARLAADYPAGNAGATWRVVPLTELIAGKNGPVMFRMLMCLSGLVLLIACSNLANLLLARVMTRAREFAVRGALGASRIQLLRPLIVESLLLALAGGGGAILVAQWATDWLSYRSTGDNGERVAILLDGRVLAWALGASLVTALAFGIVPALFALRLDLNHTLKSGARGTIGGRGHQRFRQLLIVGQFALAMILLTGAALFIRGLNELNHRRSGWESERLVSGSVLLPAASYSSPEKILQFQRLALQRLAALPGVSSASLSAVMPYFNWFDSRKYVVEGRPPPEPGKEPSAVFNSVSPHYFDTTGTHLLSGRAFGDGDTAESARVYIISESLARHLFGETNPIGRRIALAAAEPQWGEIVGVVNDVVSTVPEVGTVPFQIYQAMTQEPRLRFELAVRADRTAPAVLLDGIRRVMAGLDPDLPIRKLQTADATILRANYQQGVLRDMLTVFALLGLGLASLGIYGVIARTVAQRTGEFAIRLTLGACVRDITRLVLGSGVKQALLGATLGLLGAVAVSRLLAANFTNMHLNSLPALVGTTLLLVAVALLACWLPARRAGRVDPMTALRAE